MADFRAQLTRGSATFDRARKWLSSQWDNPAAVDSDRDWRGLVDCLFWNDQLQVGAGSSLSWFMQGRLSWPSKVHQWTPPQT